MKIATTMKSKLTFRQLFSNMEYTFITTPIPALLRIKKKNDNRLRPLLSYIVTVLETTFLQVTDVKDFRVLQRRLGLKINLELL